jgi:hypothetical protein
VRNSTHQESATAAIAHRSGSNARDHVRIERAERGSSAARGCELAQVVARAARPAKPLVSPMRGCAPSPNQLCADHGGPAARKLMATPEMSWFRGR